MAVTSPLLSRSTVQVQPVAGQGPGDGRVEGPSTPVAPSLHPSCVPSLEVGALVLIGHPRGRNGCKILRLTVIQILRSIFPFGLTIMKRCPDESHPPQPHDRPAPGGQSAFLWGARKTGKPTYQAMRFPQSVVYDLLQTDLMLDLTRRPALLREQLLARPAEDLHMPVILDEVHWLMENADLQFVRCGSSARKLRPWRVFAEENRPRAATMVCLEPARRLADGILVLPWREFLEMLWDGRVVS